MRRPATGNFRRGFTLIEVVAVMVLGSATMGLAICTIAWVINFGSQSADRFHDESEIERLSERFRRDVRRANKWELANDGQSLKLQVPTESGREGDVEYRVLAEGGIERRQKSAGQTRFELRNDPLETRLSIDAKAGIAILQIGSRPLQEKRAPARIRNIEAVLKAEVTSINISKSAGAKR